MLDLVWNITNTLNWPRLVIGYLLTLNDLGKRRTRKKECHDAREEGQGEGTKRERIERDKGGKHWDGNCMVNNVYINVTIQWSVSGHSSADTGFKSK